MDEKCKNMRTILFKNLHRVCPSLHRFSQKQWYKYDITWRASIPNFTQISQEIWKVQENSVTPVCKV
jgi:hypothetical protein